MSCLAHRLMCNTALATVLLYAPSTGDPSLPLDYNYLLDSGSTIAQSVLKGPTPTFTRASNAYAFDSAGLLSQVTTDNPRFIHDPADSNAQLGLLLEEVRTQLCLQSSNFPTTWVNINTDEPTTNNTDIFGGTTADEIAATSTADQQFAIHQSFTGLTANVNTAVAVYIKTGTNASFVQLAWDSDGGGSDGCFCNFQLTSSGTKGTVTAMTAGTATSASIDLIVEGFYRCVVVGKIATGTVGRFTINIIDRIDAVKFEAANLADNDSLIVCAADVQVGPFMSNHIPSTTASVTRASDVCTVDVSSVYVTGAGTIISNFIMDFGTNGERFLAAGGGNVSFFGQSTSHPDAELSNFDGSSAFNTVDQFTLGAVGKAAVSWDSGGRSLVLNGGTVATAGVSLTQFDLVDTFLLAHGGGGVFDSITFQTLRYYNIRQSDAFIDTETT